MTGKFHFREIMMLKKLHHTNVIQLFDVLCNEEKQKMYVYIVLLRC